MSFANSQLKEFDDINAKLKKDIVEVKVKLQKYSSIRCMLRNNILKRKAKINKSITRSNREKSFSRKRKKLPIIPEILSIKLH